MSDATAMPTDTQAGESRAATELLELVYAELHKLASSKLAREAPGQTLQPTALVHEAWLRLVGENNPQFANRAQFFHAAAEAMRRILIERARRKLTVRHGGGYTRIDFGDEDWASPDTDHQTLAIDELLDELAKRHPAQAEVVKLRYFAGMTHEEIAEVLDVSVSTVKNYWVFARAWLFRELSGS